MVEVRTKDKIFVAVLIPVALACALFFFGRAPAARQNAALRAESAQLPDEQMFPMEQRRLQTQLEEAQKELAAAKAEKPPATCVKGEPMTSAAARQDAALAVLLAQGARVVRTEPVQEATAEDADAHSVSRGGATLQATGIRPTPEAVRVTVEATYPQMAAALRQFAKDQQALVPEFVSLTTKDTLCQWEVTLWL